MTSKNERVNSFSLFLFFCDVGEILVERKKKLASQPGNPTAFAYFFLQNNNNVSKKDFHQKILFMMIYQDLSTFFRFINDTTRDSKIFHVH